MPDMPPPVKPFLPLAALFFAEAPAAPLVYPLGYAVGIAYPLPYAYAIRFPLGNAPRDHLSIAAVSGTVARSLRSVVRATHSR